MISAIIPVYNTADYLERCIDSVLNSSYEEFELILIDDGSVDRSASICEEYQKRDQRVRYFSQIHKGVSAARNKGIEESRGTWIVFIDSDDFISQDFFEIIAAKEYRTQEVLLFDFMRNKNGKRISGNRNDTKKERVRLHYGEKKRLYLIRCLLNMQQLDKSGNVNLTSPCAKAYKKSVIDQYRFRFAEDLEICEDRLFNLEYLLKAESSIYIPKIVYFVEARDGSAMRGGVPEFLQNDTRYQEKLRLLLESSGILSKVWKAYYNSILTNMADVLVRGIFYPYSSRTDREKCMLCCQMQKEDPYQKAIKYNRRTGSLPRRILLYFYHRRNYGAVKFICVVSYKVLELLGAL